MFEGVRVGGSVTVSNLRVLVDMGTSSWKRMWVSLRWNRVRLFGAWLFLFSGSVLFLIWLFLVPRSKVLIIRITVMDIIIMLPEMSNMSRIFVLNRSVVDGFLMVHRHHYLMVNWHFSMRMYRYFVVDRHLMMD